MAFVRVEYTWPEGGSLSVVVQGKTNYPDALDQMRGQALKLWTDAVNELESTAPAEPE